MANCWEINSLCWRTGSSRASRCSSASYVILRQPVVILSAELLNYDYTSPNVWSPNSPYLDPMDYYVWVVVEKDANRRASTTKAQLIDRIKAVFETLLRESVTSTCSRLLGRIENVIDAKGGYFERNLLTVVQFLRLLILFTVN